MTTTMRTLGARSHLLLAAAAAAGLIASLSRPWYGAAPRPTGPGAEFTTRADAIAGAAGRALGEPGGTAGWDAFGRVDIVLAGLAGALVLLLALSLVPVLAPAARSLGRVAALAALGLVAWCVVDAPAGQELRFGALVGLACAALACVGVAGVAAASRPSRRTTVPTYTPPPPPARDASASWGPPQF